METSYTGVMNYIWEFQQRIYKTNFNFNGPTRVPIITRNERMCAQLIHTYVLSFIDVKARHPMIAPLIWLIFLEDRRELDNAKGIYSRVSQQLYFDDVL